LDSLDLEDGDYHRVVLLEQNIDSSDSPNSVDIVHKYQTAQRQARSKVDLMTDDRKLIAEYMKIKKPDVAHLEKAPKAALKKLGLKFLSEARATI